MSQRLEQAIAIARQLSEAEQDAIAALILDEIEDESWWDETFAQTPGKLAALAARAAEQVRDGRTLRAGFDEL